MSLFVQNNLADVLNLTECRRNLSINNCAYMNTDNVQFHGGNIEIHRLALAQSGLYQKLVYARCYDNGEIYVDPNNSNIPIWLRTDIKDVDLSVFHNDINATMYKDVKSIVWNSDFLSLNNIPTLSEMLIGELGEDPFCIKLKHMSDLHEAVSNDWYIDFEMNKYALCNYNVNIMVFDKVQIGDLHLNYLKGKEGMVLHNGKVLELSNEALNGRANIGYAGMVMINSNVCSSLYAQDKLENIKTIINDKISFYQNNVDQVVESIRDNLSDFVLSGNNLSDVQDAVYTLELNHLRDKMIVSESDTDFLSLKVVFAPGIHDLYIDSFKQTVTKKYPYYENRPKSYVYLCAHKNGTYEVVDKYDFPYASDLNKGTVKVLANLAFPHKNEDPIATIRYDYMHDVNITELSKMRRSLDRLTIDNVLETIYLESTSLNTRLLRPNSNLYEMKDNTHMLDTFLINLDLSLINKTLDFNDLARKPESLGCFENDIGLVSAYNNLDEYQSNVNNCLSTLQVKSVGLLSTDNFNMMGNSLEMDFLNVMSKLCIHSQDDEMAGMFAKCHDTNGSLCWCGLPETSMDQTFKGIVRNHNFMKYDEEGTYTIQALRDVESEIVGQIEKVRTDMNDIKTLFLFRV